MCLALRRVVAECADKCPGTTNAEQAELRDALARTLGSLARVEEAARAAAGEAAGHLKRNPPP